VGACQIGGSKTRSVFGRYNIFSKADITEAATKIVEGQLKRKIRN
jgi:hypothetical protein